MQVMTILRPYHDVLPEAICCCLQTCDFVVTFMLMNIVCTKCSLFN